MSEKLKEGTMTRFVRFVLLLIAALLLSFVSFASIAFAGDNPLPWYKP